MSEDEQEERPMPLQGGKIVTVSTPCTTHGADVGQLCPCVT